MTLEAYGSELASDLQRLVRGVLPTRRAVSQVVRGGKSHIRPGSRKISAIPLTAGGRRIGSLSFTFDLELDSTGQYPAVSKSSIHILAYSTNRPIIRYEFLRDSHSHPHAHWHVHGESTELGRLLPMKRRKADSLEKIHLPVGGVRFRPGLEDVLQMLVVDIGVDSRLGWRQVIERSRAQWRQRQAHVVVRDYPEIAVKALRELGYSVVDEPQQARHPGRQRLFAY